MHKINLILGSTGAGKTRLIKKKIEENYEEYKEIFVIQYMQEIKLDKNIKNVTFFDSVKKMYSYIEEREIEDLDNILLVIDETRLVINPEDASDLVNKFNNLISTFQTAPRVNHDEEYKNKVVEQFYLHFNLDHKELIFEVETVSREFK